MTTEAPENENKLSQSEVENIVKGRLARANEKHEREKAQMAQQIEAMQSQIPQQQGPIQQQMPPQGPPQGQMMPPNQQQMMPPMQPQGQGLGQGEQQQQPVGGMQQQSPQMQPNGMPGQQAPVTSAQMLDAMRSFEEERQRQAKISDYDARLKKASETLSQLSEEDPELKKLLSEKGGSLPNDAIVQSMEFGNGDTKRGAGYIKHVLGRDKLRLELEKAALQHQLNIGDVSKKVKEQIGEYLRPSSQGGGDISEPELSSQSLKAGDDPMAAILEYAKSPDRL